MVKLRRLTFEAPPTASVARRLALYLPTASLRLPILPENLFAFAPLTPGCAKRPKSV